MEDKGEKRILGRSPFSVLIENLSKRFRNTAQYFNPANAKGKRNVVILCYALGFIGLHAIYAHSKRSRTVNVTDENTENQTTS